MKGHIAPHKIDTELPACDHAALPGRKHACGFKELSMPLNPEQSQTAFALRTLWLFLTWHYSEYFRDAWLHDEVNARFPGAKFNVKHFLRSNPSGERLESYVEPVREVILTAINKHQAQLKFPDHIRRYLDELKISDSKIRTPFNISSWMTRRRLKLDDTEISRLLGDIGGFWYVLRPETRDERSAERAVLESVTDESEAKSCKVRLNVGVLRVSTLDFSPGALPLFRYEMKSRRSQNPRLIGFAFPTPQEVIFQGSFDHNSTGQLTWVYSPQDKAADRSIRHNGLLLARNSVTEPIAAPVFCVRVPLCAFKEFAPDEPLDDPRDVSGLHDRHFDTLNIRTRDWIGVHTVAALTQAGILTQADIKPLSSMFSDRTVFRI